MDGRPWRPLWCVVWFFIGFFIVSFARYFNDIYYCLYDSLKRKCNSTAADIYTTVYYISTKRALAATGCTISNSCFTYCMWLALVFVRPSEERSYILLYKFTVSFYLIFPVHILWRCLLWLNIEYLLQSYHKVNVLVYTVNRKKVNQNVFIYILQNLTDCGKIRYILSWVNLLYRSVNVFHFT